MKVDFYHLTVAPLDRVLPMLADKVLESGGRLLVVAADETQRTHLDRLLWVFAPDSFLPHAIIGGDDDANQPILIASDVDAANRARNVLIADGAWREEVLDFDRAFHLFDDETIKPARVAWKSLIGREGIESRYWKQNDAGRWEQAA